MSIHDILSSPVSRFSKDSINILEDNINQQVKENSYNREVNLALFALYRLYPETINTDVVNKVLCKALMNLPSSDFTACLHVLPIAASDKVDKTLQSLTDEHFFLTSIH